MSLVTLFEALESGLKAKAKEFAEKALKFTRKHKRSNHQI